MTHCDPHKNNNAPHEAESHAILVMVCLSIT